MNSAKIEELRGLLAKKYPLNSRASWTLKNYVKSRTSSQMSIGETDESSIGVDLLAVLDALPDLLDLASKNLVADQPKGDANVSGLVPEQATRPGVTTRASARAVEELLDALDRRANGEMSSVTVEGMARESATMIRSLFSCVEGSRAEICR